jgi:hypothetical protein
MSSRIGEDELARSWCDWGIVVLLTCTMPSEVEYEELGTNMLPTASSSQVIYL